MTDQEEFDIHDPIIAKEFEVLDRVSVPELSLQRTATAAIPVLSPEVDSGRRLAFLGVAAGLVLLAAVGLFTLTRDSSPGELDSAHENQAVDLDGERDNSNRDRNNDRYQNNKDKNKNTGDKNDNNKDDDKDHGEGTEVVEEGDNVSRSTLAVSTTLGSPTTESEPSTTMTKRPEKDPDLTSTSRRHNPQKPKERPRRTTTTDRPDDPTTTSTAEPTTTDAPRSTVSQTTTATTFPEITIEPPVTTTTQATGNTDTISLMGLVTEVWTDCEYHEILKENGELRRDKTPCYGYSFIVVAGHRVYTAINNETGDSFNRHPEKLKPGTHVVVTVIPTDFDANRFTLNCADCSIAVALN